MRGRCPGKEDERRRRGKQRVCKLFVGTTQEKRLRRRRRKKEKKEGNSSAEEGERERERRSDGRSLDDAGY